MIRFIDFRIATLHGLGAAMIMAALACGGGGAADVTGEAALDSVAVTPSAVTLQVGATQPLTVAAFANGRALTGVVMTFASQNGSVAEVDDGGLVRAVGAGSAVVEVSVTRDGIVRIINVPITVTTAGGAPPAGGNTSATVTTPGSTFSPATVTIVPGGNVTWQISGNTHNVTFGASQPTGGNIPNTSSGTVTRVFPTAGTYPYQCTLHSGMSGAVLVQVPGTGGGGGGGQAADAVVSVTADSFTPEDVEIAPGGTVLWVFSGATNNVTFEEEQPPGGNVPDTAPGTSVSRTFPVEGDYKYSSTRSSNMRGRIRVR